MGPAQIWLKFSSVNSLNWDLSNATTFNPPLLSLVNTFNGLVFAFVSTATQCFFIIPLQPHYRDSSVQNVFSNILILVLSESCMHTKRFRTAGCWCMGGSIDQENLKSFYQTYPIMWLHHSPFLQENVDLKPSCFELKKIQLHLIIWKRGENWRRNISISIDHSLIQYVI